MRKKVVKLELRKNRSNLLKFYRMQFILKIRTDVIGVSVAVKSFFHVSSVNLRERERERVCLLNVECFIYLFSHLLTVISRIWSIAEKRVDNFEISSPVEL